MFRNTGPPFQGLGFCLSPRSRNRPRQFLLHDILLARSRLGRSFGRPCGQTVLSYRHGLIMHRPPKSLGITKALLLSSRWLLRWVVSAAGIFSHQAAAE